MTTFKIVRFYAQRKYKRTHTLRRGLTLEEVQKHCNDPETSSSTAKSPAAKRRTRMYGAWFDGYFEEK